MAVLVAGIGYLGAPLVADLLASGEDVFGIENYFSTDRRSLQSLVRAGLRLFEGSITSPVAVRKVFEAAGQIDTLYLLAAQASAHPQAAPASYTERTNLLGPRLVLDAAVKQRVGAIVYASSSKLYGEELPPAVPEDTPFGVISDLAHLAKCYAEKLTEMYAVRNGIAARSVRLGVVYGLGPVMKHDERFMTAPNKFCRQAALGESLVIHAGAQRPTGFIYLADAVRALQLSAKHAGRGGYAPVNAAPQTASVREVAEIVAGAAARRGLLTRVISEGLSTPRPAACATRAGSMNWDFDLVGRFLTASNLFV